jgi:hypothetical protein
MFASGCLALAERLELELTTRDSLAFGALDTPGNPFSAAESLDETQARASWYRKGLFISVSFQSYVHSCDRRPVVCGPADSAVLASSAQAVTRVVRN